jgi:hypothetical protein
MTDIDTKPDALTDDLVGCINRMNAAFEKIAGEPGEASLWFYGNRWSGHIDYKAWGKQHRKHIFSDGRTYQEAADKAIEKIAEVIGRRPTAAQIAEQFCLTTDELCKIACADEAGA